MNLFHRFVCRITAAVFLAQSIMPAYGVLPSADREIHAAGRYASHRVVTDHGGEASAGILTYAWRDGRVEIAVGERNDGRGVCSWGGLGDPEDNSLPYTAYRETKEETNDLIGPHFRLLARNAPFHDFLSSDNAGAPNLFRLYLLKVPHIPAQAFLDRQKSATESSSQEYASFQWVDLEEALAGVLPAGLSWMPEFKTALETVGPDLLKILKGGASFSDWVSEYTPLPGFTPAYDQAPVFSDEALALTERALDYVQSFELPPLFGHVHGAEPAAAVSSSSGAERDLSMTERHLSLALGEKFQDPRKAADPHAAHVANLLALLEIQPFRNLNDVLVDSMQAVMRGAALMEIEVDMSQKGYYAHYHGLDGVYLFLYAAWGLQKLFLQNGDAFQFALRGHDLYFRDGPATLQEFFQKYGTRNFYKGLTSAQLMCCNMALGVGCVAGSSSSNSWEYFSNSYSADNDRVREFFEESAILRGLPSDPAPYLSLFYQYLAYRGNPQGLNGGMLQIFVPRAGVEDVVSWGWEGDQTWSTFEEKLQRDKSVKSFDEGRLYIHPNYVKHTQIAGTWFYPPTAEAEAALRTRLVETIAMDMVDAAVGRIPFFRGSVFGQGDVWPAYNKLGVADRVAAVSEIEPRLVETLFKLGMWHIFEQFPLSTQVPALIRGVLPALQVQQSVVERAGIASLNFMQRAVSGYPDDQPLPDKVQRQILATFALLSWEADLLRDLFVKSHIAPELFEEMKTFFIPPVATWPLPLRMAYSDFWHERGLPESLIPFKESFDTTLLGREIVASYNYFEKGVQRDQFRQNMERWFLNNEYHLLEDDLARQRKFKKEEKKEKEIDRQDNILAAVRQGHLYHFGNSYHFNEAFFRERGKAWSIDWYAQLPWGVGMNDTYEGILATMAWAFDPEHVERSVDVSTLAQRVVSENGSPISQRSATASPVSWTPSQGAYMAPVSARSRSASVGSLQAPFRPSSAIPKDLSPRSGSTSPRGVVAQPAYAYSSASSAPSSPRSGGVIAQPAYAYSPASPASHVGASASAISSPWVGYWPFPAEGQRTATPARDDATSETSSVASASSAFQNQVVYTQRPAVAYPPRSSGDLGTRARSVSPGSVTSHGSVRSRDSIGTPLAPVTATLPSALSQRSSNDSPEIVYPSSQAASPQAVTRPSAFVMRSRSTSPASQEMRPRSRSVTSEGFAAPTSRTPSSDVSEVRSQASPVGATGAASVVSVQEDWESARLTRHYARLEAFKAELPEPRDLATLLLQDPTLSFEDVFPLGYMTQWEGDVLARVLPQAFENLQSEQHVAALHMLKVLGQLPKGNLDIKLFQRMSDALVSKGVPLRDVRAIRLWGLPGSTAFSLHDPFASFDQAYAYEYIRDPLSKAEGQRVVEILEADVATGGAARLISTGIAHLIETYSYNGVALSPDGSARYRNAAALIPALWESPTLRYMLFGDLFPYLAYFKPDLEILGVPLHALMDLWRQQPDLTGWAKYQHVLYSLEGFKESKEKFDALSAKS